MTDIIVRGIQTFRGIEIPVVYGGFGENQKCVTAKSVAEIHGRELRHINWDMRRLINNKRLVEHVDYVNLLNHSQCFRNIAKDLELMTSNRTKDAFLLSERGYMKLIKYMDDDTSWAVMEDFIDEYFRMRYQIESDRDGKQDEVLYTIQQQIGQIVLALNNLTRQVQNIQFETMPSPLFNPVEIKTEKPVYTAQGKAYRDEITALCRELVHVSDFADVKEVLSYCYTQVGNYYHIDWRAEQEKFRLKHDLEQLPSVLNVLSEMNDERNIKGITKQLLKTMLAHHTEKEPVQPVKKKVDSFEDALQTIMDIASAHKTIFAHPVCVYNAVYGKMNELNHSKINWKQQRQCYQNQHDLHLGGCFARKDIIKDDPILTNLFTTAVNLLWEEMKNAK